jgi:hypothetical protein
MKEMRYYRPANNIREIGRKLEPHTFEKPEVKICELKKQLRHDEVLIGVYFMGGGPGDVAAHVPHAQRLSELEPGTRIIDEFYAVTRQKLAECIASGVLEGSD